MEQLDVMYIGFIAKQVYYSWYSMCIIQTLYHVYSQYNAIQRSKPYKIKWDRQQNRAQVYNIAHVHIDVLKQHQSRYSALQRPNGGRSK